jgi:hypothetical protein
MATQTPQLPIESGRGSCLAPSRSTDAPLDGAADRYERLFPDLPPIEGDEERLLGLAGPGSICDGGDACPDAVDVTAGWPMFGQLIAHDITADRSPLAHRAAGERRSKPRAHVITGPAPHRGSRSNSRTPPSATATARSARTTSSTRDPGGCACSRTCSAFGRSPPTASSTGTDSSTFPAAHPPSARS